MTTEISNTRIALYLLVCFALIVCATYVRAQTTSGYEAIIHEGNAALKAGNAEQALSAGKSAIHSNADRWEGYALTGGALMSLKRFEEAADNFSDAIKRAPEDKQTALRDLRHQSIESESVTQQPGISAATTQPEIVLWKSVENSHDPSDFQSYLDQYPHGAFANLAQRHMADAKAQRAEQANIQRKKSIEENAWTDATSILMWARLRSYQSSMDDYDWDFNYANTLCKKLPLLEYTDWRLPTKDELQTFIASANGRGYTQRI